MMMIGTVQDIPRLEIPLHTLIELVPKPDGKMAETRISIDVDSDGPPQVPMEFIAACASQNLQGCHSNGFRNTCMHVCTCFQRQQHCAIVPHNSPVMMPTCARCISGCGGACTIRCDGIELLSCRNSGSGR